MPAAALVGRTDTWLGIRERDASARATAAEETVPGGGFGGAV